MAIINNTSYDISDLNLFNLGHILRKEFLKSPDSWVRMSLTDSEEIQLAFDELSNGEIDVMTAVTMEETIEQGVSAAFEESGEIVQLESCYLNNEFLLNGKMY